MTEREYNEQEKSRMAAQIKFLGKQSAHQETTMSMSKEEMHERMMMEITREGRAELERRYAEKMKDKPPVREYIRMKDHWLWDNWFFNAICSIVVLCVIIKLFGGFLFGRFGG